MIASCMRYCTVSRREMPSPKSLDQPLHQAHGQTLLGRLRSTRSSAAAGNDRRPARRRPARSSGIQQAGSIAWAASSITTRSNVAVAQHLAIDARQRRTQHGRRIEQMLGRPAIRCAGRRRSARGLGPHLLPCARQRFGPREASGLVAQLIGLLDQLAGNCHVGMCIDQQIERVLLQLGQHAGRMTQADCFLAARNSRSSMLSTARLLGAQASTFSPRALPGESVRRRSSFCPCPADRE